MNRFHVGNLKRLNSGSGHLLGMKWGQCLFYVWWWLWIRNSRQMCNSCGFHVAIADSFNYLHQHHPRVYQALTQSQVFFPALWKTRRILIPSQHGWKLLKECLEKCYEYKYCVSVCWGGRRWVWRSLGTSRKQSQGGKPLSWNLYFRMDQAHARW